MRIFYIIALLILGLSTSKVSAATWEESPVYPGVNESEIIVAISCSADGQTVYAITKSGNYDGTRAYAGRMMTHMWKSLNGGATWFVLRANKEK